MRTVRGFCRVCNKSVAFDVADKPREHYPFSFIYYHGHPTHALITYIDANYKVRGEEITEEFGGFINAPMGNFSKKCIVTGDWGVGKTTLINLLTFNKFDEEYSPTITAGIQECQFVLSERLSINVEFWEAAGQHSNTNLMMRRKLFNEADTALILCDVARPETMNVVPELVEDIHNYAGNNCLIFGLANKVDLRDQRKVEFPELESYKEKYGIPFIEISLKERENVDDFLAKWLQELATYSDKQSKKFSY
ncbi:MAG TPA: Rab family GTPase [Candidatus Lokiarchaeia archaeon]|nr:Rab family GTPase [Candidatus Lokiarchaeia archaeon]